jgi:2'-5' RNA ligase
MRLFIAVDLPEQVKDYISQIAQPLRAIPGIKPVNKENIHITMKFLGEVEESTVG